MMLFDAGGCFIIIIIIIMIMIIIISSLPSLKFSSGKPGPRPKAPSSKHMVEAGPEYIGSLGLPALSLNFISNFNHIRARNYNRTAQSG